MPSLRTAAWESFKIIAILACVAIPLAQPVRKPRASLPFGAIEWLSPDGREVVVNEYTLSQKFTGCDTRTGLPTASYSADEESLPRIFSADGSLFISFNGRNLSGHFWRENRKWTTKISFPDPGGFRCRLCFEDSVLAVWSDEWRGESQLELFNAKTGVLLEKRSRMKGAIEAFAADNASLVIRREDPPPVHTESWNPITRRVEKSLDWLFNVAVDLKTSTIAGRRRGNLEASPFEIWDWPPKDRPRHTLDDGKDFGAKFPKYGDETPCLGGDTLALCCRHRVTFWNIHTGAKLGEHIGPISHVASSWGDFSPDGTRFLWHHSETAPSEVFATMFELPRVNVLWTRPVLGANEPSGSPFAPGGRVIRLPLEMDSNDLLDIDSGRPLRSLPHLFGNDPRGRQQDWLTTDGRFLLHTVERSQENGPSDWWTRLKACFRDTCPPGMTTLEVIDLRDASTVFRMHRILDDPNCTLSNDGSTLILYEGLGLTCWDTTPKRTLGVALAAALGVWLGLTVIERLLRAWGRPS